MDNLIYFLLGASFATNLVFGYFFYKRSKKNKPFEFDKMWAIDKDTLLRSYIERAHGIKLRNN